MKNTLCFIFLNAAFLVTACHKSNLGNTSSPSSPLKSHINAQAPTGSTLRSLGTQKGFVMGAGSADSSELSDPNFAQIAASQYNAIEPGNSMKMNALEPAQNIYSFSADAVAAFAQAHGQTVTATAPIWDGNATDYGTGNPTWLMNGGFSAAQLQTILQNYITTIMQHYHNNFPGVVNRWAVVSEATHLCGVFCQTLGTDSSGFPAYIALAYQYARQADPTVQLCYDDWGAEGTGSEATQVYNLVSSLRSRGLIDCVGMEGQWEGTGTSGIPSSASIVANINQLGSLGVQVYFSQVEIGIPSDSSSDLQSQASAYSTLLSACLSTSACKGFFSWGVSDNYAFCYLAGMCSPLPFDSNYNPKPAYYALQTALGGTSSTQPTPTPTPAQTTECVVTIPNCPNHLSNVGTYADNYTDPGYSVGASSNQAECMQRAKDYYVWCGTTVADSASYYINGAVVQAATYPPSSTPSPTPTPTPTPTPAGPTGAVTGGSMGCYSDSSTRALPTELMSAGATVESCVAAAKAAGYAYGGVQYGGQCFAGNSLGHTLSAPSNCNIPCAANTGEICGGTWFNSIYSTGYLGCYSDSGPEHNPAGVRALPNELMTAGATIESCVAAAKAAGYAYAGVQYGGQCFAGNSVGSTLSAASSCNIPCSANSSETCGGTWFNSIYSAINP